MLAIQALRTGGPDVLEVVDLAMPEPAAGQIRIRHEAIGLNFIDTYHRSGLYPIKMPAVLGQEAAGIVDAVGEGVTRFKIGDRAAYGTGPIGAYAEAHVVPANRAVHLPVGVSTQVGAAAMLKGMTAEFLLRRCYPLKAGEAVLIHAAKAQGCDHVILYRDEDVAAKVKAITRGAGVRVAYDGVGAATFEASLASLGRRGILVSFGNASGPAPALEPARLARGGSLFLTRPTLFDYVASDADLDESAAALFHVIEDGAVKIDIGQTFPLAEARRAHEALEARRTTGQTLLIP
jgi:NADPH2:quinone reductase